MSGAVRDEIMKRPIKDVDIEVHRLKAVLNGKELGSRCNSSAFGVSTP